MPLLAQPGPLRLAIHWAFLSSLHCLSTLPCTSLLWAAPLAAGEMTPTREIKHWAFALTTQVLTLLRYWLMMSLSYPSISWHPVEWQRCSTLLSAQLCRREWRCFELSAPAPAT